MMNSVKPLIHGVNDQILKVSPSILHNINIA